MARHSYWDYIKAAFSAKPKGMFLPPNWVGLAAVGMLGFLNPGIWIIGAGLELGYLLACGGSKRFRKVIDATASRQESATRRGEISRVLAALPVNERQRYQRLVVKCQDILKSIQSNDAGDPSEQAQGLAHFAWIHLSLLSARDVIQRHLAEARAEEAAAGSLEDRLREVEAGLKRPGLTEELRRSLEGRETILKERLQSRRESIEKLDFTAAELSRIEEQVQLMRDQSALQSDPALVSGSIDRVTGDLREASAWIREQRHVYRDLDGALDEPPPASILAAE